MSFIKYITPINLATEKATFFSSSTYNPQFRYSWDEPEVIRWVIKHPEMSDLVRALKLQEPAEISAAASAAFDTKLTPELLTVSKQIVSSRPEIIPPEPIEAVIKAFNQAFNFLELDGYSVKVVDEHGFNFRPLAKIKMIVMSKHLNLDFFSIDGEVKHELAHIIRYENGKYNGIPKSEMYLPTEEGLATYCQDYSGENGAASLFQHAAEYAMTEVSLNGSLREVVEFLLDLGFSKELAWQRAIRHKFGFMDTSNPVDIMKPSMYFYHEQLVKQLSTDEKYRLFVGKITTEQLVDFSTYTGIIPLEKLRKMYTWSELPNAYKN